MLISDRDFKNFTPIKTPIDYKITKNLFLNIRQTKQGYTRTYIFRSSFNGKQKRLALGTTDLMTITTALGKSEELLIKVKAGIDIFSKKDKEKTAKQYIKFSFLVDKYREKKNTLRASSKNNYEYFLKKLDIFNNKDADAITDLQFFEVINNNFLKKNNIYSAYYLFKIINEILNIREFYTGKQNTLKKIKHLLPPKKEVKHFKALDIEDVENSINVLFEKLLNSSKNRKNNTIYTLIMLFFSMTRKSELVNLSFSDLDLKSKKWHVKQSKTLKEGFDIPLTEKFLIVLAWGLDNKFKFSYFSFYFFFKRAQLDFSAHGTRSLSASWMIKNGIPMHIVDACLTHAVGNIVTRSYIRTDFFEDKLKAFEKWHEFLYRIIIEFWPEIKNYETNYLEIIKNKIK